MADVFTTYDYYPGGSIMPGRSYNSNAYRYGWNKGSEKDDEITGVVGSHYTTYFREFDTRLNRTWSYDPSSVAWESPYAVNRNNPIVFVDPMGDWPKWLGGKGKGGFSASKRRYNVGKRRDNSTTKVEKPKPINKTYEQVFIAKGGREVSQSYLTGLSNSIDNFQNKFDATGNDYYRQRMNQIQQLQTSISNRLRHELDAIKQPSDQEELGMSSIYKSRNLQLNYGILHDGQFFNITFNNNSIFSALGIGGATTRGSFSQNNIRKGSGYTLSLTNTPAFETYRSAMGTGASSTFTLPDGTVVTSTISFTVLETLQYGISVFQKRRWNK